VIYVADRKPAGRQSFAEVQDAIREKLEERRKKTARSEVLEELYRQAVIDSPYLPRTDAAAENAGASPPPRAGQKMRKKGPERS
jgi:hypothetical protein